MVDFDPKVRSRIAFRVVIPAKPSKRKPQKKKEGALLHQLLQTKIDRLIKQAPPFQHGELQQAKEVILVSTQTVYKHYLPEFSAKQLAQASLPKMIRYYQQVEQASRKASIDSFVIIADQLVAEGKSLSPTTVQKLLDELILSPQDFQAIQPLLITPKKQRFPASKYSGPGQAALEEAEGGTPFLFLPERAKLLLLAGLTYPIRSSLTTSPEATFDLTDPLSGQPIREQIQTTITSQGINRAAYENLREITSEVKSLALYCLGLTPQALNQTIEGQRQLGVPQNAPVLKMLRIFYQDMISLEKEVGLPLKLVPAWAQAKAEIEPVVKRIQVGTHRVLSRSFPRRLTYGLQARTRTRFLTWGIRNQLYDLRGSTDSRVRVYNRVLLPVNRLSRAINHRLFQPIIVSLSRTTFGKTLGLAWARTKSLGLQAAYFTGKKGFGRAIGLGIKKAGIWLAAKLGLTAIASVIGTPIGGAITFIATELVPRLIKGVGRLLSWPFRTLKNLLFGKERRAERAVYGFGGLMQWMTSGEFFGEKDWGFFKWIFIGIFALLFFLGLFIGNILPSSAWLQNLVPSETRYIEPHLPGRKEIASQNLEKIFEEVARQYCVPKAIIMAISQMEAGGTWSYRDEEVTNFSTPDWWEKEGCKMDEKVVGDCTKGYCYDTCRVTDLCPSYSVVGPMQFEESTWNGYKNQLEDDLSHEPHRCNLRDSIFAAAMKIKADSGTGSSECTDWNKETVRRATRRYCGSCGIAEECGTNPTAECEQQHRACGYSYCEAVWLLYNEYR